MYRYTAGLKISETTTATRTFLSTYQCKNLHSKRQQMLSRPSSSVQSRFDITCLRLCVNQRMSFYSFPSKLLDSFLRTTMNFNFIRPMAPNIMSMKVATWKQSTIKDIKSFSESRTKTQGLFALSFDGWLRKALHGIFNCAQIHYLGHSPALYKLASTISQRMKTMPRKIVLGFHSQFLLVS